MLRYSLAAGLAVLLCACALIAAEYPKAKITKIDTDKNTVTFTVPGEKEGDKPVEKTISFDKDKIKLINAKDKDLKGGFESKAFSKKALETGVSATVTTDKVKDGDKDKEVITTIKLNPKE
jgi:hypothetical protein